MTPLCVRSGVQAGRRGMARVDRINESGTRINHQPLCIIELTVQPRVGPAYRTKIRQILTFEKRVALGPGTAHPVGYLG